MKKKIKVIKRIASPEALFFTAFIARLVVTTWYSTMFPQFPVLQKIALAIVLVCSVAKILLYDSFSLGEIVAISTVGICTVMNFLKTGSSIMLVLLLLVVAAKGIDSKKILRVYIIVVGCIVAFVFICSLMGVIRNLRYWKSDEHAFRNSFGIVYCTDFSARIFFLLLAYFYVRNEKLKWYEFIITIVVTLLTYGFTKGDLDFYCSLIMVVLFAIGNNIGKLRGIKGEYVRKAWNGMWRLLTPFAMLICCILMYILTALYDERVGWMYELNDTITNRLAVGHKTLQEIGFALFGKRLVLHGFGGNTSPIVEDYNFLDCSYIHVLIMSGATILFAFIILYAYVAFKNGQDTYLMYVILLISINCMIAHHLQDISYIPFILFILAKMVSIGEVNVKTRVELCINS